MAVEVDDVEVAEPVEGLEQRQLGLVLGPGGGAAQVLDQDPRVDLLLDVDRRRVGDEVLAVELVLALPDELRIERRVARVADLDGLLDLRGDELVRVGGREVRALVGVRDRIDRGWSCRLLGVPWPVSLPRHAEQVAVVDVELLDRGVDGLGLVGERGVSDLDVPPAPRPDPSC